MSDKALLINLQQEFNLYKKQINELVSSLQKENAILKSRLAKYENPKNSNNSSISPSQDPFRKTKSQRKSSNKKPGGQHGHKGSKLNMRKDIDEIVVHDVTQCACCGNSLNEESSDYDARQIIDLPVITMKVTEHRRLKKNCTHCGKQNKGIFPENLVQKAQYGTNLKSLCVYLQNYQMLPYARCQELIYDLTGHRLSTGSLSNFQKQCTNHLEEYEQEIKKLLLQSSVIHADETGIRLNGKNNWVHVLGNAKMSLFGYDLKRGKQAMDKMGVLPNYEGTLIHDRFSSYFSYHCQHSLCNAHILRNLTYIKEAFQAPWASEMARLFILAKDKKHKNDELRKSYYSRVFKKYTALIRPIIKGYNKKHKKTEEQRLAFALEKHKYLFLKFIKQPELPFDNNQAERDLRMIKVKQKVSGCFRSPCHAQYFATIRGYLTTIKKNNKDVLQNIKNAFANKPFIPILSE